MSGQVKKRKVVASGKSDFKTFQVEIPDITWGKRCELNDMMIEANSGDGIMPSFSFWGEIVLNYTTLTEDQINNYSTDEIKAIANKVFEVANSKKK